MTPLESWALFFLCFGILIGCWALLIVGLESIESSIVKHSGNVVDIEERRRRNEDEEREDEFSAREHDGWLETPSYRSERRR